MKEHGLLPDRAKLTKAVKAKPKKRPSNVVKFGFLYEMLHPLIIGAVEVAVDAINRNHSILPNVRLEYEFRRIHSRSLHRKNQEKA